MSDIVVQGPVAYMSNSKSAVYFSMDNAASAPSNSKSGSGTYLPIKKLQNILDVAYWGEDNRFPQNVDKQLRYCGVARSALNYKAKSLWGSGIIAGTITGYKDDGSEIFKPIEYDKNNPVIKLLNSSHLNRAYTEFLLDFAHFYNCFPEMIFSKDTKTITGFVHQESCDSRFKQNDQNVPDTIFLSKLWGMSADEYAQFDPKKMIYGLVQNPPIINEVDNKFVKALDCIDMYNAVESAKKIADKHLGEKGLAGLKSAILPVNYPSPNKTLYQLPYWDGARLSGWFEIAAKVPNIYKTVYNNAFNIKYHIEVPTSYFTEKYGQAQWNAFSIPEKDSKKRDLLKELDDYLSGDEKAGRTIVTTYIYDNITKQEFGRIKITCIDNKSNIDKDLLASSAANVEILMSMQIHPAIFSAGMTGNAYRSGGGSGSDIREAFIVQNTLLASERNICLEPLNLIRDYNLEVGGIEEWDGIVFRIKDTVLTTLDTGAGSKKVIS